MPAPAAVCLRIDVDARAAAGAAQALRRLGAAARPGQRLQVCVSADRVAACAAELRQLAQAGHGVDLLLDLPAEVDPATLAAQLAEAAAAFTQAQLSWWGASLSARFALPAADQPTGAAFYQTLMDHGVRWVCATAISAPPPHLAAADIIALTAQPLPASGSWAAALAQPEPEVASSGEYVRVLACSLSQLIASEAVEALLAELAAEPLPFITLTDLADVTLARHQSEPAARERVTLQQFLQFRAYWDETLGPTQQAYKVYDYRSGWRLKPGYYRRNPGGWERLTAPAEAQYEINQHGLRGPLFPHAKPAGETRVLLLGDSCVFGVAGRTGPWPAQAQLRFDELAGNRPVRVLNAGIEGQSSVHSLMRLKRLLTFEPDWVVVVVAGNDLFIENPATYRDTTGCAYASAWEVTGEYPHEADIHKALGTPRPMPLENFYPHSYAYHLHAMAQLCRSAGVGLALMTLPCLFPGDLRLASEAHRRKMHAPPFVSPGDMTAMRHLYDCYNTAIQRVAAEAPAALIDAEAFFRAQFDDQRAELFSDTCHPTVEGNVFLGRFVAESVWELINSPNRPTKELAP